MYKIPTLFERDLSNGKVAAVWNQDLTAGVSLVPIINGGAQATEKVDGTSVLIDKGRMFARLTLTMGDLVPSGWVAACPPINTKMPGWVPCRREETGHKWHWAARDVLPQIDDGTYELVGPKVNGNPYGLPVHQLWEHGETHLQVRVDADAVTAFHELREYLEHARIEGIVWWYEGKAIAKIKTRDFGIRWPHTGVRVPVATAEDGA